MAKKSASPTSAALLFDCHSVCYSVSWLCSPTFIWIHTLVHFKASTSNFRSIFLLSSFLPHLQRWHLQNPPLLSWRSLRLHQHLALGCSTQCCVSLALSTLKATTNDPLSAHRDASSVLLLLPRLLGGPGARFGLAHQIPVGWRAEEARIAVFGHEHVNLVLGQIEARWWGG